MSGRQVKYTRNPNNWNARNVTLASAGSGIFFILEGWLTILKGRNLFHLPVEGLRSFVLLMLVFTSQFRIYLVRERRHFWDSRPGRGILISSAAAIVVFSLLGIFGGIIRGLGLPCTLGEDAIGLLGIHNLTRHGGAGSPIFPSAAFTGTFQE